MWQTTFSGVDRRWKLCNNYMTLIKKKEISQYLTNSISLPRSSDPTCYPPLFSPQQTKPSYLIKNFTLNGTLLLPFVVCSILIILLPNFRYLHLFHYKGSIILHPFECVTLLKYFYSTRFQLITF